MANLQAAVRSQAMAGTSLTSCLERANALLFRNTSPEKFATLFFGCLDAAGHILHYCNAGHNHPFLIGNEIEPLRLSAGGLALGCFESFPFEESQVALNPGDRLIVFSDGISEAVNDAGEEFGEARICELAAANRDASAAELIEKILQTWVSTRQPAADGRHDPGGGQKGIMIDSTISHYRILEKIGEGGMGVVYKAEDIKLKRAAALKFLPPDMTADPVAKERFVLEAQAASALNHAHVTTIYGIEESPEGTFIAMEYVEGKTLKELLGSGNAFPFRKCWISPSRWRKAWRPPMRKGSCTETSRPTISCSACASRRRSWTSGWRN